MLAGWNYIGAVPHSEDDWGVRSFDNEMDARDYIWKQARLFALDLFLKEYDDSPASAADNLEARNLAIYDLYCGTDNLVEIEEYFFWVREEDK